MKNKKSVFSFIKSNRKKCAALFALAVCLGVYAAADGILPSRMTGEDIPSAGKYDYLDIRDDRNVFYFSIAAGSYKEFRVRLRAAYEGKFVLPSVTCEAMYDSRVFACTASGVAEVTR